MDIVELYVIIDDFCNKFMPKYINLLKRKQLKRRIMPYQAQKLEKFYGSHCGYSVWVPITLQ